MGRSRSLDVQRGGLPNHTWRYPDQLGAPRSEGSADRTGPADPRRDQAPRRRAGRATRRGLQNPRRRDANHSTKCARSATRSSAASVTSLRTAPTKSPQIALVTSVALHRCCRLLLTSSSGRSHPKRSAPALTRSSASSTTHLCARSCSPWHIGRCVTVSASRSAPHRRPAEGGTGFSEAVGRAYPLARARMPARTHS